jgi:hypothetical protein
MFQDFNVERFASDPNAQTFSSSSVMMYSSGGKDGKPTYYQASSSSSKAPGGLRECRRSVCDSESGIQKMSVGHHIGDRGHVLERSVNRKTGVKEEKRDFLNMDEDDGHAFAREWEERAKPYNRVYRSIPYKSKERMHRTGPPAAAAAAAFGHLPARNHARVRINTPAHGMGGDNADIHTPVGHHASKDRVRTRVKTPARRLGRTDADIHDTTANGTGLSLEGQSARKSKKTVKQR